jgi:AmpD protein
VAAYPDISSDNVVGHCDIAPHRKTDPGQHFDWSRYRSSLLASHRCPYP